MSGRNGKRKRGRPKGAKNRVYVDVEEAPAVCPKCGSANLSWCGKGIKKAVSGRRRSGFVYSSYEILQRNCKNCGQYVRVHRYHRQAISEAEPCPTIPQQSPESTRS